MELAIGDREALIGAYLRERAGLARRGATDRVAQVDAELARLGYVDPDAPAPAAAPLPRTSPPKGRRTSKGTP